MVRYLYIGFNCSLVKEAISMRSDYLTVSSWKLWAADLLESIHSERPRKKTVNMAQNGESPALEVIRYRDPKGYFAGRSSSGELVANQTINSTIIF